MTITLPHAAPAPDALDERPNSPGRTDQLFAALYRQLHQISRRELARLGPHAPMGASTLLHEAYLGIAGRDGLAFDNEAQFVAYAARAMRGVVIDQMRARQALKRGGGMHLTGLNTAHDLVVQQPGLLGAVSDALDELAALEPELALVVDLKFFGGYPMQDVAALCGRPLRTVERQWEKARLLLLMALQDD